MAAVGGSDDGMADPRFPAFADLVESSGGKMGLSIRGMSWR